MSSFAHDIRLALRSLARNRAFTIVACLTLAIGIGATTAIFSVINGVLLHPLPYPTADELVLVNVAPDGVGQPGSMSYPDIADLRDQGRSFRSLIGVGTSSYTLTGLGEPAVIEVARVTEGVLATFGVAPVLGRDIALSEFGEGGPRVVVLGHAFWRERFGGARDVLGQTITLNAVSYEVVGVAPPEFSYPASAQLWIPRSLDLSGCGRGCHTFQTIGRLATGVTIDAASAELTQVAQNFEAEYPATNTGKRFMVRGLKDAVVGDARAGLWITFGAAALVLLIACANVANLLLARASAREGELAVRIALGATRARIAAYVLAESAVLAAVGGVAGVVLAVVGTRALRQLADGTIPRADLIAIDGTVLVVTLVSIVCVMFLFGAIPAFTAARSPVTGGLASIGRGGASARSTMRFRRVLLAGEVALSAALLIGAGLLMRTFTQLYAIDVGFETHDVTRFNIVLPDASYPDIERGAQFYAALEEATAALPGVEAVGTMFGQPLGRGHATGTVLVEGRPAPTPAEEREASVRSVTPGLLTTLRIPLTRGRLLTPFDNRAGTEPVALVNEEFVRQHFPNEDPIGKRVELTVDFGYGSPVWRIVGVVGDVRFTSLATSAEADLYVPHALFGPLSTAVHVRTVAGAPPIGDAVREIVRHIDPNVPVHGVETIQQVMRTATAPSRLYLVLVALFAGFAAVLAAVGLYGVVSYLVVQRTREIGIRVALGAQRDGIVALVVRQGMQPALIGLVIGVVAALALGRYLESILFGVRPHDPVVFGVAVALMATVALIATAIPAVRASGIDPARVLQGN